LGMPVDLNRRILVLSLRGLMLCIPFHTHIAAG